MIARFNSIRIMRFIGRQVKVFAKAGVLSFCVRFVNYCRISYLFEEDEDFQRRF